MNFRPRTADTNGNRGLRRLAVSAILLLCGWLIATGTPLARAGTGSAGLLPMPPKKPKNGLQVEVDSRWVNSNGYRPVRVKLLNWPGGPTPADRSFRVELEPGKWQQGWGPRRVTGYVEMPQGKSQAEAVISVPQFLGWNSMQVKVFEDGYELRDLTGHITVQNRNYDWSETTPTILVIDSDAPMPDQRQGIIQRLTFQGTTGQAGQPNLLPDIRPLTVFAPDNPQFSLPFSSSNFANYFNSPVDDALLLRTLDDLPKVEMLPPSWLPTKWLDLTCFDVIFISLNDLKRMAASEPERLQALRDWLVTGPTLCVTGVELTAGGLLELEKSLGMPADESDEVSNDNNAIGGWKKAGSRPTTLEIRGMREVYQARGQSMPTITEDGNVAERPKLPFVSRRFGLGRVIAMEDGDKWATKAWQLAGLFNEIDRINWAWHQRHGLSFHRENSDYWDWMIPGIGQAPVNSYLVLISLFVIGIGPVNYYLLQRKKRLYLLLLTVPLGAGLVTLTLLNYALISDGLGARVRIRSFTELDQRTGHAVTWSRQTYYAGLAPSRGLSFPDTAAVYPIDHHPNDYREQSGNNRHLIWDDGQKLASGYMNSRSTSQFLVIQSQASTRQLKIEAGGGSPPSLRVTNGLGVTIQQLLLCDLAGQHYLVKDLADGQAVAVPAVAAADGLISLRTVVNANRPSPPPGYDPNYYQRSFGYSAAYSQWSRNDSGMPATRTSFGIMERSINELLLSRQGRLEPQTYAAIVERSPEVAVGLSAAREEASFHVILGRW